MGLAAATKLTPTMFRRGGRALSSARQAIRRFILDTYFLDCEVGYCELSQSRALFLEMIIGEVHEAVPVVHFHGMSSFANVITNITLNDRFPCGWQFV